MATTQIEAVYRAVKASGIPVTTQWPPVPTDRPISGTSTPSQHNFANALDYYPTSSAEKAKARRGERVPSLENLYQFLVDAKGEGLPASTVCYYRRGGCTTDHLDHVHVSGSPKVSSLNDPKGQRSQEDKSFWDRLGEAVGGDVHKPGGEGSDALRESVSGVPVIGSITDFLSLLAEGELWVRVGYIAGGFAVGAAGVYFIAKEFGAPSVTQVASAASGGVAGAASKAVKGAT